MGGTNPSRTPAPAPALPLRPPPVPAPPALPVRVGGRHEARRGGLREGLTWGGRRNPPSHFPNFNAVSIRPIAHPPTPPKVFRTVPWEGGCRGHPPMPEGEGEHEGYEELARPSRPRAQETGHRRHTSTGDRGFRTMPLVRTPCVPPPTPSRPASRTRSLSCPFATALKFTAIMMARSSWCASRANPALVPR